MAIFMIHLILKILSYLDFLKILKSLAILQILISIRISILDSIKFSYVSEPFWYFDLTYPLPTLLIWSYGHLRNLVLETTTRGSWLVTQPHSQNSYICPCGIPAVCTRVNSRVRNREKTCESREKTRKSRQKTRETRKKTRETRKKTHKTHEKICESLEKIRQKTCERTCEQFLCD